MKQFHRHLGTIGAHSQTKYRCINIINKYHVHGYYGKCRTMALSIIIQAPRETACATYVIGAWQHSICFFKCVLSVRDYRNEKKRCGKNL